MTSSAVSNDNLSNAPNSALSSETSTATLTLPATHPEERSLDSLMSQSQVGNASKEKNVLENSSDKSLIMMGAELSLTKKRKGKKRRVKGHDSIERNHNLLALPKDASSMETSTAALAVPPTHPDEHSLDSVMRQAQVENASIEKNVLENSLDKSQIMTGTELSLTKKRKRKRRVKGQDAVESNYNLSAVPKDAFSTETSTAALAVPPTNPDEHPLASSMRQLQVENASKKKNVLENSLDKSQIMTGAELSLTKKRKRKKKRVKGHDAIERNDNLSAVPKDSFSTETSTAALAVPPTNPEEHPLDSLVRQSQVENASKEKSVLENSFDTSQIMIGAELSLTKKRKRKKRVKGHDAIESNDNLSAVPKDAFSTETSTAALAVPPTNPHEHSLRQSQVENASKENNVLENSLDKSQIMTAAELSLTKKRKRKKRVKGHDAIESNDNLSAVPKDAFSTETSTAALVVPPTHPDEHSLDSVMGKARVENALKEKNVLENSSDKSQIMTGAGLSLTKKRKRKKGRVKGHDAIESNDNVSTVPKDAFSTETYTAALVVPPTHPDEHSPDSVMRQAQVENASKENNVIENPSGKSQIMTGAELSLSKKRKRKKRSVKGQDAVESNYNLSAVPKDAFSTETSSAALAGPPAYPDEHSLDYVMKLSQAESASKENNVIQNSSDKSQIMPGAELSLTNKRRKKRRVKGHDAIESNDNPSAVPKDAFLTETSTAPLAMPPTHPDEHSVDPVMRQAQVENASKENNVIENSSDKSQIMTGAELSLSKKRKGKRRVKGHDAIESSHILSAVPTDSLSVDNSAAAMVVHPAHLMSQGLDENQGKDPNMVEKATDGSPAMTSAEVNSRKKDKGRGTRKARHDSSQSCVNIPGVSKGDISHSTLVSKHDHCNGSHSSLGGAVPSYSKKKLLVLDLNGLLADIVLGVPKGYKPNGKIHDKAVFKRPFCDDFLKFCFDKFHVGIWSSRKRKNVDIAIKLLVGVSASKLLFAWNQSHCTVTKFQTIEDKRKPIMLKELRKLWEKKREFNETNTLLLDDSPYKAIRNPMHTAIFPHSYRYDDANDTSLGPGGDLRVYLEGLAMAENVQEYVASHPFGQPPITESSPHWEFYCSVRDQGLVLSKKERKKRDWLNRRQRRRCP